MSHCFLSQWWSVLPIREPPLLVLVLSRPWGPSRWATQQFRRRLPDITHWKDPFGRWAWQNQLSINPEEDGNQIRPVDGATPILYVLWPSSLACGTKFVLLSLMNLSPSFTHKSLNPIRTAVNNFIHFSFLTVDHYHLSHLHVINRGRWRVQFQNSTDPFLCRSRCHILTLLLHGLKPCVLVRDICGRVV